MSAHTPGPWFDNGIAIKSCHADRPICHLPAAGGETTLANARLIAAAPELLEALQVLADEYEPNLKTFAENAPRRAKWMRALAAIKKATEA